MSEKRRDNKNRILRSGESQRKDGRYAYKYTDTFGKVQFVYAWKLVPTDKTPAGKRDDISLREKEKNRYERFLGKDVVYTEYSFEEFAKNPKKIIDLAK